MPKKTREEDKNITVDFEPIGRRISVPLGTSLLAAARQAGVQLISLCGGIGACESCRIRIVSGDISDAGADERSNLGEEAIEAGIRLACQTSALGDIKVDVPPDSLSTPQRLQLEGRAFEETLDPSVTRMEVKLDPPSLDDPLADDARLLAALREGGIPPGAHPTLLRQISDRLRQQAWRVGVALGEGEIVAVLPPDAPLLGLAVDIGTTKLAAYLLDLQNGRTLAKTGAMNPQIGYGEDVISRIAFSEQEANGRQILQTRLIETLNEMIHTLCTEADLNSAFIVNAVVVGNTAMHHLFAGLPVRQLGVSPYVPAVASRLEMRAVDLGLALAPAARVYMPPNIAGYIGADHVAMLLATDIMNSKRTTIALDVGTNTEITLASQGRLLSCSCASGPAFEGAHIQDGMRAAPGAIERVQIEADEVRVFTIGSQAPVGICGSGILDAIAEMLEADLLDRRGEIRGDHPRIRRRNNHSEFVLVPASDSGHGNDIVLTRADINELQLAKGAIRAGMDVLLREAGIDKADVEELIIAGAFGTYLDVENAVRVGMFPTLPNARVHQVGNAAGAGAQRMLLSKTSRQDAEALAGRVQYIELTTRSSFNETFTRALFF